MQRTVLPAVALLMAMVTMVVILGGPVSVVSAGSMMSASEQSEPASAAVIDSADEHLDCDFPIEVTDTTGETVTIEEEPQEIVVLGASAAQQLWEFGLQEKVTGMPMFFGTAYLEDREAYAEDISEEGHSGAPEAEKVIAQDPDLVLAPSIIQPDDVAQLREAGLTVHSMPAEASLQDVYDTIERNGQLVGACDEAAAVIDDMQNAIESIQEGIDEDERPGVYYALGGGWTAGTGTVEDDMIDIAGGDNIAADEVDFYGEISEEIVVERTEVVVISEGAEISDEATETFAVEHDQIVQVDANFISQPGPRMVDAIEQLADGFADVQLMAETEPVDDDVDETDDVDDADEADETDDVADEEETDEAVDDDETDVADDDVDDDADDVADDGADDDGIGFTVVPALVGFALILGARWQLQG